jgi:hypothetical protein
VAVSECRLPLDTGSMRKWNKAEIGTIAFSYARLQLLTFPYGRCLFRVRVGEWARRWFALHFFLLYGELAA